MGPDPPPPSLINHDWRSFDRHHRRCCFPPLRRRNTRSWLGNDDALAGSVIGALESLRAALGLFLAAGRDRIEGRGRCLLRYRLLNVAKSLTGKRRRRKGAILTVSTQTVDQLETRGSVNRGRAKNGSLRLRGEANEA